jgi:hypothetical protein
MEPRWERELELRWELTGQPKEPRLEKEEMGKWEKW